MIKQFFSLLCASILLNGCATTSETWASTPTQSASTMPASHTKTDQVAQKKSDPGTLEESREVNLPESPSILSTLESLTVEEALRLAEANRPDLEALRHRIGMAEGEAQQAGLWPNPTLSLGLEGYTPNGDSRPTDLAALDNLATLSNRTRSRASAIQGLLFPDVPNLVPTYELWVPTIPEPRDPDQLQEVVSITQPLPIWGTPRLARKAGLLETERWRHEYERAKLELQSQVRKAFDEVVFHQERLATTDDLQRTLNEILDVTRARLDAGDIAEVELIKGEADYERFSLEAEAARTELHRAKTRLTRVLGNPKLSIQSCAGAATSELPELPEATLAQLREDHPQVRVWEAAEDAAEANIAVATSRRLPVPTLGIGYRHYEFTDQDTFDVSLEFEVPLFDRKQGEIRAAREKAKFESASNEAEKINIEATLVETFAQYESHRRQSEAFQQRILPKMEESLSIARTRFEAGDTSMLEVLDAYRSLAEARLAFRREQFEARIAFHDLSYMLAGDSQS